MSIFKANFKPFNILTAKELNELVGEADSAITAISGSVSDVVGDITDVSGSVVNIISDVDNIKQNYMPLSGGTFTGPVTFDNAVLFNGGIDGDIDMKGHSIFNLEMPIESNSGDVTNKQYVDEHDLFERGTGENSIKTKGTSNTVASGEQAIAFGQEAKATGKNAIALGYNAKANGEGSFAEGGDTYAIGLRSHAEGWYTRARANNSHSEGYNTFVEPGAVAGHAEGYAVSYIGMQGESKLFVGERGSGGHAGGLASGGTIMADGYGSFAQGFSQSGSTIKAEKNGSFAGGYANDLCDIISSGQGAYAFGYVDIEHGGSMLAHGNGAHAEGINTTAMEGAHAEGVKTVANGWYSHAEGGYTVTTNSHEHAEGSYNVSHTNADTAITSAITVHAVGIGTREDNRKNAVEIMRNGDVYIIGVGGYSGTTFGGVKTLQEVIAQGGGSSSGASINLIVDPEVLENLTTSGSGVDAMLIKQIVEGIDASYISIDYNELNVDDEIDIQYQMEGHVKPVVSISNQGVELTNGNDYSLTINGNGISTNSGYEPLNANDVVTKGYVDSIVGEINAFLESF